MSRDHFCHTLLGAAVMEGAVKVTSGAAYSRWDPRLRGGAAYVTGKGSSEMIPASLFCCFHPGASD